MWLGRTFRGSRPYFWDNQKTCTMLRKLLSASLALSVAGGLSAQIGLSGLTVYSNGFDTYAGSAATLPADVTANTSGTFRGIGTGTSATGGYYAFEPAANPGERSLGFLRSSSNTFSYTLTFQNTDAAVLTALNISYNFEQYRFVNTSGIAVTSTAGDVSALSQDGVATGVNGVPSSIPKSTTLLGLNIAPGANFTLTFTATDATGSDNGLAIDDLSVVGVFLVSPLPVALTTFGVEASGLTANLAWATASERDNAFFGVEVSRDGETFAPIGRVAGNGDSRQAQRYRYSWTAPASGAYYFRLRQVDQDGAATFSDVVAARLAGRSRNFQVGATIARSELTLDTETGGRFRIVNAAGQIVLDQQLEAGRQSLDVSGLAEGIYVVTDGETSVRFVR